MPTPALALPWILFGRSFAARDDGDFDGAGIRRSPGLWWIRNGELQHYRGQDCVLRKPGEAFLTEPGDRIVYEPRARFGFLHFDLVERRREPRRGRAWAVADDEDRVHPPLAELLPRLSQPLTAERQATARNLLLNLLASWWVSDAHHWRSGVRLGAWLADVVEDAPDLTDPLALAEHFRRLCRERLTLMPTVQELRESLGVGRESLHRACQLAFQATPAEVLEQERIAVAQLLLLDPRKHNLDLAEIAFGLGYADRTSFSRSYRRIIGVPPAAARGRRQR